MCIRDRDWAAIGDVDYTASTVLAKAIELLHQRQIRLMFSSVLGPVRHQLDRYGITADGYFETPGEALDAFRRLRDHRRVSGRYAYS